MSEVVKGVLGGAWGLVVGWFFPSALALVVFGVVVLPDLEGLPLLDAVARATPAAQATVLLVATVALGLVLAAVQTPLYRFLEGYLGWPEKVKKSWRDKHTERRQRLEDAIRKDAATTGGGRQSLQGQLMLEKYHRYPAVPSQIAPTMLGNAIRRFEYYAQDRYQLDSQRLWYQLRAVAPDSLNKDADNSRVGVDFFVCLCYLSALLCVVSAATAAVHPSSAVALLATAATAAVTAIGCYRGAVLATDSWAAAVQAMVDLGRVPLAKSLGLVLPRELEDERDMWQTMGWILRFPHDQVPEAAKAISRWRLEPAKADGGDDAEQTAAVDSPDDPA